MNRTVVQVLISVFCIGALAVFVFSCNMVTGSSHTVAKAFNERPDTDVTTSNSYHFASLAGTTWSTRTKMAVAEVPTYKRKTTLLLLPPQALDPTSPMFTPLEGGQVLSILPPGTKIKIERLMEDHGVNSGVYVQCRVLGGTNNPALVQMGRYFFSPNRYLYQVASTNWTVNPGLLQRPAPAQAEIEL